VKCIPITLRRNQKICKIENKPNKINNIRNTDKEIQEKIFKGDETLVDPGGKEIQISRDLTLNQRKKALELLNKYTHIFTTDLKKVTKSRCRTLRNHIRGY